MSGWSYSTDPVDFRLRTAPSVMPRQGWVPGQSVLRSVNDLATEPTPWWRWACHNCIAHPLLVLCPPLGRWLHDRTEP